MLDFIKREANIAYTENGAVTNETTGSDCLDLFASIGALRRASKDEVITRFIRAYTENADMAMKLLFFARDIRGGLGERRVFRVILSWLAKNHPASVIKNLNYIPEYGRYDDLLVLLNTPCETTTLSFLRRQFEEDMKAGETTDQISLLAKWLPSVNASNSQTVRNGKKIAKAFGMTDAEYRRALTYLRGKIHIIENYLRKKEYSFAYETQTSRSMFKYRKAFLRNDSDRYMEYLNKVRIGTAKLHADHVSPYELVEPYMDASCYWNNGCYFTCDISSEEKEVLNVTWDSLPSYGNDENTIAVIDTSGSMYWGGRPLPAAVAISLGLYFAEHNKGIFKNHFIEFSTKPRLIEIKGATFYDRLRYILTFCEAEDTNLEAVFDLLLKTAVKNHVSQKEMPSKLVIISDMEFNCCVWNASKTVFQNAKESYKEAGYQLPEIVFWNVASRNRQQPVTMNEQGAVLISGVTPRLFEMVAGGKISPYAVMMEILTEERYAKITA